MEYEPALKKLREKWPVDRIANYCVYISDYLGKILQREFPGSEVFTAMSGNLRTNLMPWVNHQVSVIKENDSSFLALDATRPLYEKDKECWMFRAGDLDTLMEKLKDHYTGDWKINQKYTAEDPANVETVGGRV